MQRTKVCLAKWSRYMGENRLFFLQGHLSDNARLMLSLLLLLRSRGRNPHEDIPSLGLRRGFSRLESHSSELSGCGRRAAAVEAVREELREAGFEEVPGREHFLKLCGKVRSSP